LIPCGLLAVEQATPVDGPAFDARAFAQDGLPPAGVDVGRGQVAQAPMVAPVVVALDEGPDPRLEVAGQVVVPEQEGSGS
jgi:hypothetical protein